MVCVSVPVRLFIHGTALSSPIVGIPWPHSYCHSQSVPSRIVPSNSRMFYNLYDFAWSNGYFCRLMINHDNDWNNESTSHQENCAALVKQSWPECVPSLLTLSLLR